MQSLLKTAHGLILLALMLTGIELFVWFYLGQQGFLQALLINDKSRVSLVIILIYMLATLHFLWSCYSTSKHFNELYNVARLPSHPVIKRFFDSVSDMSDDKLPSLLEVLDTRLRSQYAFGFIVADLMLKLGILGTVIGFIIMLGSLSNLNSVDITVMQTLLAEMSAGMRVALYTTLSGMLAGILLNIKYNLVDWAMDHLLNDIREQVHRND